MLNAIFSMQLFDIYREDSSIATKKSRNRGVHWTYVSQHGVTVEHCYVTSFKKKNGVGIGKKATTKVLHIEAWVKYLYVVVIELSVRYTNLIPFAKMYD